MKRRILAVLLSLTLAGAFVACGGSKEGAETTAAADESISDLSMASNTAAAATESTADASDAAASQTQAATAGDTTSTAQTGQTDVITPIPAQEITDGTTAAGTTTDGTTAADGTTTSGTTADGTAADGTTTAGTTADGTASDSTIASQTMVTTADINVREEADFEGDILGGYDEGDKITVTGAEGEWYIVDYYGEKGYVYSKYLKNADSSSGSSSGSSSESSGSSDKNSDYSKYGKLIDGDGDPVDLRYYDGSYEIYDEDGNEVIIEGVND